MALAGAVTEIRDGLPGAKPGHPLANSCLFPRWHLSLPRPGDGRRLFVPPRPAEGGVCFSLHVATQALNEASLLWLALQSLWDLSSPSPKMEREVKI